MNFKELQDEVSDLLNFNSSQTDQDFTTSQIKKAINRAYLRETNKARQEGLSSYFKAVTTFTWPSGSKTVALPSIIQKRFLINMEDITGAVIDVYVDFEDAAGGGIALPG